MGRMLVRSAFSLYICVVKLMFQMMQTKTDFQGAGRTRRRMAVPVAFLLLFSFLSPLAARGMCSQVVSEQEPAAKAAAWDCPRRVTPLFPCTPRLEQPYGVCTHITRTYMDYPLRDRELEAVRAVGMNWVRSDLDFGTVFGSPTEFEPRIFDDVMATCEKYDQKLLGILTWLGKMPWDDPEYAKYVETLARRYDGKMTHWEMMNEVNLMHVADSMPERYAQALHVASQTLHRVNPQNRVLLTGLGEVKDDFLEDLCKLGAMKDVDVMNFHSYFRPEELIQCYAKIRLLMDRYGWEKPVWVTECGMHTSPEQEASDGFYLDMLPAALQRLGIQAGRVCVGYLADRRTGYVTLDHRQAHACLAPVAGKTRAVALDQLATLKVKDVPVLVATTGEHFPLGYFPDLVGYVRRGGTIVLSGGMPFYYDACLPSNTWFHSHEMGTSLLEQLHMSAVEWWSDGAAGENLTEHPSLVKKAPDAGFAYQWTISDRSPARYLSDAHLAQGDTLIPLITAGTEHVQAPVAGIYRLNSDLKGNIVFQTRMYASPQPDKEQEQARRVARMYLLAFAHGVDRVFWYNLRAKEADLYEPEDCFGLIHADFSEKPSMQAYRTMVQMMPSGSTRPQLVDEGNVFTASWTRPDGKQVTAMWSPYVPVARKTGSLRGAQLYDHLGAPKGKTPGKLTLSDSVVYIVK